jgi:hypothetical protein
MLTDKTILFYFKKNNLVASKKIYAFTILYSQEGQGTPTNFQE